jgi:hypothetical protein
MMCTESFIIKITAIGDFLNVLLYMYLILLHTILDKLHLRPKILVQLRPCKLVI